MSVGEIGQAVGSDREGSHEINRTLIKGSGSPQQNPIMPSLSCNMISYPFKNPEMLFFSPRDVFLLHQDDTNRYEPAPEDRVVP